MNNLDFDNMTNDEIAQALKVDEEERELLERMENEEWVNVPNMEEELQKFQAIAKHQLMPKKISHITSHFFLKIHARPKGVNSARR